LEAWGKKGKRLGAAAPEKNWGVRGGSCPVACDTSNGTRGDAAQAMRKVNKNSPRFNTDLQLHQVRTELENWVKEKKREKIRWEIGLNGKSGVKT